MPQLFRVQVVVASIKSESSFSSAVCQPYDCASCLGWPILYEDRFFVVVWSRARARLMGRSWCIFRHPRRMHTITNAYCKQRTSRSWEDHYLFHPHFWWESLQRSCGNARPLYICKTSERSPSHAFQWGWYENSRLGQRVDDRRPNHWFGFQRCLRPWHNKDNARKNTWFPLSVCCPEITLRGQRITVSLFWKSKRFGEGSLANAAGKWCRGLTMGRDRRWEFVLDKHYVRWKKFHYVFVVPLLLFVQVSST